jgi:hypothetical protein
MVLFVPIVLFFVDDNQARMTQGQLRVGSFVNRKRVGVIDTDSLPASKEERTKKGAPFKGSRNPLLAIQDDARSV